MSEKRDVVRVFTTPTESPGEVVSSSSLVLMVGDTMIDGVYEVEIEKIQPDNVITAIIRVAVTLGDK